MSLLWIYFETEEIMEPTFTMAYVASVGCCENLSFAGVLLYEVPESKSVFSITAGSKE
jgi:hypothetical protein